MPKVMKYTTILSFAATILLVIAFRLSHQHIFLVLAITFATTAYHFGMRLLVGLLYNVGMRNRADYTKKWYQIHSWEKKLYQFLRVKVWKNKMPTYNPQTFSTQTHTWDEIAQTMCQSELVHETNVLLSFLPLIASLWFDSFAVFFITSLCGALFDLLFVMMQRYNRERVLRIVLKQQ